MSKRLACRRRRWSCDGTLVIVILVLLLVGACGVVEMAGVLEGLLIRPNAVGVGGILVGVVLMAMKVTISRLMERR